MAMLSHPKSFAWVVSICCIVFGPGVSLAAVYTVGPTGTPGTCTHTTIQAAIDAAASNPGSDEIRIAANQTWGALALYIENQDLDLSGGFSDCFPLAPTSQTTLSGAGGLSASVINVSNTDSHLLRLHRLQIVDGDPVFAMAGSRDGGGLRIRGPGRLELEWVRIADNRAFTGGGIFLQNDTLDFPLTLAIADHVQIEDNQAIEGYGGGIYMTGVNLTLAGVDTSIRRNSAGNNGGGIALLSGQSSTIDIASAGADADGVISANTTLVDGGGIYVEGNHEVYLYTSDPVSPVRLERNHARSGGAIYAERGAAITMWEAIVSDNVATGDGAAVYLDGAILGAYRIPGASSPPAGATACALPIVCNLWEYNRALSDNGIPASGALATIGGAANTPSSLRIESAVVRLNQGINLLSDVCFSGICPLSVTLTNSAFVENTVQSFADSEYGSSLYLDTCTIADLGTIDSPMFNVGNGVLSLSRSIIWQPGRTIIGSSQVLVASFLLLHDVSQFPADPYILEGDPRFVDPANGNFQLMANSPALDIAPVDEDHEVTLQDLARAGRVVDLPQIENLAGPLDLGAWERQEVDILFSNDFDP
jgi:hypothetical protein